MPSEKRQRQDEGRLNRRVAENTATKRQQRFRTIRNLGGILALLLVVAFLVSVLGKDDKNDSVDTASSSTTENPLTSTTAAGATVQVTYPGPGESISGDTPCPKADGSSKRTTSFTKAPPTCIADGKTYTAKVETTEGTMVVSLDPAKAPISVNNFVVLARYHYFDGVPFHRIVPGFVDQAGTPVDQSDPLIDTTPGYTIADELPDTTGLASPADAYPDGTLAMANKGAGTNTGSSQFFIVVGGGGQQFAQNANYSVFGKVTEGLDIATAINAFGDGPSGGTPTKAVTITKVTITES
jgi:peptidyl-prolyl cis-trans isomerase B (cyclophilin B)